MDIKVGHNMDIMQQSECLVVNPIKAHSYGLGYNCTYVF